MTFINDTANINYNFTSYNTLANWKTYADTIPNTTYSLDTYDSGVDGVWKTSEQIGFFQIILPSTHDYLEITWGNSHNPGSATAATTSLLINGVVVDSITNIIQTKTYIYNYTGTPTVRVSEGFSIMNANIVIKLEKRQNIYSVVLPQAGIELQLLLLDSTKYREIVPFTITNSTFQLIVGQKGAITSFVGADTGTNGTAFNSGRVSNITGSNVSYNTPIAIVRYRIINTETVQLEVDGLLKYSQDNGWLIDTAINDTVISNTSIISILQSQMIQVFQALTAKSINAVYEWATNNQEWKIIEPNKLIYLPNENFQIRLRAINVFANNAVLPF